MPTLKIERLQHAMLCVTNAERSAKFYREVLLMEQMERRLTTAVRNGAWFKMGNTRFHLAEYAEGHPRITHAVDPKEVWDNHIAFEVEDIEIWRQHFEKLGVPYVLGKLGGDFMQQIYVRDPDNNLIELIHSLAPY